MTKSDLKVVDWLKQLAENTSMTYRALTRRLNEADITFNEDDIISDELKSSIRAALKKKSDTGKSKLTLKLKKSSSGSSSSGPAVTVRAKRKPVQKTVVAEDEPEDLPTEAPKVKKESQSKPIDATMDIVEPTPPVEIDEKSSKEKHAKHHKPAPSKDADRDDRTKDKKTPGRAAGRGRNSGRQAIADALDSMVHENDDYFSPRRRRRKKPSTLSQGFEKPTAFVSKEVTIPESIMVSELAQKMSVKSADLIKSLMKLGVMATINQVLDQETAIIVVEEFGHKPKALSESAIEDDLILESDAGPHYETQSRPPVVTIMGHVDHGKTSLLDSIRRAKVTATEAGGITQHIGAYQVALDSGVITFLDTPGHEAFSHMRARGAGCTDIVVLVVAADDGVMPQTIEAISHAKAAGVPIVVAINKMDKPEADPERVTSELTGYEVVPEDWGGESQFCPVSAQTGEGIDQLLEAILLQAEVLELKAAAEGSAKGVVVESKLDKSRGPVATILVQSGLLQKSDIVLAGQEYGRVRMMVNDQGHEIKQAGPSVPVEVVGLSGVPIAGDDVVVVQTERKARSVANFRLGKFRKTRLVSHATTLDNLFSKLSDYEASSINIILKADTQGSIEAISDALTKLSTDEVKVKFVAKGVGGINGSDINLAIASDAIVLAFNVRADASARQLADSESVDVRYYSVIYNLIDEVKSALSGMLKPEVKEVVIGLATVRDVFRSSKIGSIAGCMVTEGVIKRQCPIRVLRDNVVIYQGELESLRHYKDDVNEVKIGSECGIGVRDYNDVKVGDMIEVYEIQEIQRTLD